MEKKNVIFIAFLIAVVIAVYSIYSLNSELKDVRETNEIYENLFYFDALFLDNEETKSKAMEYYITASQNYDLDNYDAAILNCEFSREYSSDHAQRLREIKFEVEQQNDKIFLILRRMISTDIDIDNNLYEACEYFESASRQYAVEDFLGGGDNIDLHNEKIEYHDDAVERYNSALAEYTYELKNLRNRDEIW